MGSEEYSGPATAADETVELANRKNTIGEKGNIAVIKFPIRISTVQQSLPQVGSKKGQESFIGKIGKQMERIGEFGIGHFHFCKM